MKRSIYLILNEDNGHIKVGISKNPKSRLKQLQTGSSAKLTILYQRVVEHASKIESNLHHDYQFQKVNLEWFDLSESIIDEIDRKITKYESNFILLEKENYFFE